MQSVYLDHNATTPLLPESREAMRPLMAEVFGNPSSAHQTGRKARQALEDAREKIAFRLGASPDEVTFTSGATEANNLAIFGLTDRPGHLIASPIEHPCVVEPILQLQASGFWIDWLPVSTAGIVRIDTVSAMVRPETQLVSVMLANHETGAIQPVRELVRSLPAGIQFHCDAAQAVGKISVDFKALGATALTASSHKFGGPKGVGLLLVKRGTVLRPLMFGGHQQQGRRPGTEPVALIVGMAAALDHAAKNMAETARRLHLLRRKLFQNLDELAAPVVLNGPPLDESSDVGRISNPSFLPEGRISNPSYMNEPTALPTTLNVSFPGCRADVLLMVLDLAGVACSTGSACSSGSLLPSPVLRAMHVPDEVLRSAIRLSLGYGTTSEEIGTAAAIIASSVWKIRQEGMSPANNF